MSQERALSTAKAAGGAGRFDFAGRWKNQLGSEMRLMVTGDIVTGWYESVVGKAGGRTGGDLSGFINGDDLIAFVVRWREFEAVTAWSGQIVREDGKDVLKTLWHLVKNIPDPDELAGMWTSVNAGADSFTRSA